MSTITQHQHDTRGLDRFVSGALHFEGFWPEDQESRILEPIFDAFRKANFTPPPINYVDGWA